MFNTRTQRLPDTTGYSGMRKALLLVLKAAGLYFLIVFGTGFLLGTIRVQFLVPGLGVRWAELAEQPFMLIAIILGARIPVRHFRLHASRSVSVMVGLVALCLVMAMEFSVGLWLQGMTFSDYLARRDPVSGTVYYLMLLVFAAMPLIATRFYES